METVDYISILRNYIFNALMENSWRQIFLLLLEVSRILYSNTELLSIEKLRCTSEEVMYFYVCVYIDTQYLPRNKGRKFNYKKK